MIIILTLGFDEKFALRAVARRGLTPQDEVLVILAEPVDERVERAYRQLKDLIKKIYDQACVNSVTVDAKNFDAALNVLVEEFSKRRKSEFIINLSGGFRALILEVLAAALLADVKGEVESELEDFTKVITFPLTILKPINVDNTDLRIMSLLGESELTLSTLTTRTGLGKTTVWRRLKRLEEVGLASHQRLYKLTSLGLLTLKVKGVPDYKKEK
ncbi:MAG: CRISPR-associated CARF protein Csa3 [Nitrososphaerales archaeon]